jgi:hypothetical protein
MSRRGGGLSTQHAHPLGGLSTQYAQHYYSAGYQSSGRPQVCQY